MTRHSSVPSRRRPRVALVVGVAAALATSLVGGVLLASPATAATPTASVVAAASAPGPLDALGVNRSYAHQVSISDTDTTSAEYLIGLVGKSLPGGVDYSPDAPVNQLGLPDLAGAVPTNPGQAAPVAKPSRTGLAATGWDAGLYLPLVLVLLAIGAVLTIVRHYRIKD